MDIFYTSLKQLREETELSKHSRASLTVKHEVSLVQLVVASLSVMIYCFILLRSGDKLSLAQTDNNRRTRASVKMCEQ